MTALVTSVMLRRLHPYELPALVRMEAKIQQTPLRDRELLALISGNARNGIVATKGGEFVGYILVEYLGVGIHVNRLGVLPNFARRGIARSLLWSVSNGQPGNLTVTVPESNLSMQCFLRSTGMRATRVLKGYVELDSGHEDAYVFVKSMNG